MRKRIIIGLIILYPIFAIGQNKVYGLRFAGHFQNSFFSEVGFVFYKNNADQWIGDTYGPSIGIENNYRFKNKGFIIAPKIGYDYFFFMSIFQTGIHLIDYIGSNNHDVRLSPEVGLALLAMFNVSYSYQINISNTKLADVSSNKISLKLNLVGMFNGKLGKYKYKKSK